MMSLRSAVVDSKNNDNRDTATLVHRHQIRFFHKLDFSPHGRAVRYLSRERDDEIAHQQLSSQYIKINKDASTNTVSTAWIDYLA